MSCFYEKNIVSGSINSRRKSWKPFLSWLLSSNQGEPSDGSHEMDRWTMGLCLWLLPDWRAVRVWRRTSRGCDVKRGNTPAMPQGHRGPSSGMHPCHGAQIRQQPCSATRLGTKGCCPAQTTVPALLAVAGGMPREMWWDVQ